MGDAPAQGESEALRHRRPLLAGSALAVPQIPDQSSQPPPCTTPGGAEKAFILRNYSRASHTVRLKPGGVSSERLCLQGLHRLQGETSRKNDLVRPGVTLLGGGQKASGHLMTLDVHSVLSEVSTAEGRLGGSGG